MDRCYYSLAVSATTPFYLLHEVSFLRALRHVLDCFIERGQLGGRHFLAFGVKITSFFLAAVGGTHIQCNVLLLQSGSGRGRNYILQNDS